MRHAAESSNGTPFSQRAFDENFCIIESRETVKDFANLQSSEIRNNITARRNKIFLLMEEVRRLRIQQRLKGDTVSSEEEIAEERYSSVLPQLLPPLTEKTLNNYFTVYAALFLAIIGFGGLVSPVLEVKLGLGGTSYLDWVRSMGMPDQLAYVDPIVASFCGGAVGVLSTLLLLEVNNVKQQQQNRCHYCMGTGYLTCGSCIGSGITTEPEGRCSCAFCAGTGKVMCTGCLCTGKQMATEHDPRIDPFD